MKKADLPSWRGRHAGFPGYILAVVLLATSISGCAGDFDPDATRAPIDAQASSTLGPNPDWARNASSQVFAVRMKYSTLRDADFKTEPGVQALRLYVNATTSTNTIEPEWSIRDDLQGANEDLRVSGVLVTAPNGTKSKVPLPPISGANPSPTRIYSHFMDVPDPPDGAWKLYLSGSGVHMNFDVTALVTSWS